MLFSPAAGAEEPGRETLRPVPAVAIPQGAALSVHGQTVYRWQREPSSASATPIATAATPIATGTASQLPQDCTLLRGDCVLEYQGKRFEAESILMVVDGHGDAIQVRLLMDRVGLGSGQTTREPIVASLRLSAPPQIRAQQYRGQTEVPADWWAKCGVAPTNAASTGPASHIAPVQYSEPIPAGGPTPAAESVLPGDPHAFVQPLPAPAPEPDMQMMPPSGLTWDESGITSDPALRSPSQLNGPVRSYASPTPAGPTELNPVVPLPEPPIMTDSGGTTGGWAYSIGGGSKSIELLSRGTSHPTDFQTIDRTESNETIVVATGGITVLVRDVMAQTPTGLRVPIGTVSLSANRIVAWTPPLGDIITGAAGVSDAEGELYLEGDIVVRQGDQIIYADAMYYNAAREVGVILDAEVIATIPQTQGTARVKAEVMRQVARGNFVANNAAVTSSRLGVPRYWLQSNELSLTQRPVSRVDPDTNQVISDTEPYVSSSGNFVYLGGVPVLYWPRFSTPLRKPTSYLNGASIKSDQIFGRQVMLEWDTFQLLGMNTPDGVESSLLTDYLSERGPALGSHTDYTLPGLFGVAGPVVGTYDSYIIKDHGLDNIGNGRNNLVPEEDVRGAAVLFHRHDLANGWEYTAELGFISDRNFLEQYFENRWDQRANRTTGMRLRKYHGSQLFDANFNVQVNDFFEETERLPELNHYALGGSLLGDRLTWSMHNQVGYQRLNPADAPLDPATAAVTATLPGEVSSEGIVARTRQEISMPIDAGPVKIAPFAIGEASQYGQDINGDDLTRLWGGGGIRANLPLSRIDPTVQSSLLNVRGLAHKVNLTAEYFYADSNTDYDELPYYDPLDDHTQQQFRRSFIYTTYGGMLPDRFDPRSYALRQGIQGNVTSPSDTIADDLQQFKLGMNHRFQTKRGLPGRERIVDLFRFDMQTILMPEADRDNYGELVGPTIFDAQYNLGDRVALLGDGYIDFFDDGLRSLSGGVRTSRPGLGDLYVGLLSLEGPISSTVLQAKIDHRLNEKWIVSAGTVYDFGSTGSNTQSFGLTRIGESFLFQIGANVDAGRDNTSFGFTFEPRFLPSSRLGLLGGQMIPPPGVEGLE
ncbi:LPS-assembly protein LptD [Allorhodopirellula solitaria]|nr:organic solvent tolerance protein OstA [Allorhodopirellula solitaria]